MPQGGIEETEVVGPLPEPHLPENVVECTRQEFSDLWALIAKKQTGEMSEEQFSSAVLELLPNLKDLHNNKIVVKDQVRSRTGWKER